MNALLFSDMNNIFTDPELLDQTINLFVDILKPNVISFILKFKALIIFRMLI